MTKPILVIKFGSASITSSNGELDELVLADIARQTASLQFRYNIVIVSSGAVAAGKRFLKKYKGSISERKAAASIGNPLLLNKYAGYFSKYGISIAQSLCERQHFSNRSQFLQLKRTFEELWASDIIPIANENDVVSNLELKFSDNDELATLIAVGFGASMMLFSTSVLGVLDNNNNLITSLNLMNKETLTLAHKHKSEQGLGGMISKLTFARLATRMGIQVVIFGIRQKDGILMALEGKAGTVCIAQECTIPARKKWLASGSLVTGKIKIDAGAVEALMARHSLLSVGVKTIIEKFECGEVIEILNDNLEIIAVARVKLSSDVLSSSERQPGSGQELAHSNDIVLL